MDAGAPRKGWLTRFRDSALVRSVFPRGIPRTDTQRKQVTRNSFFLHLHPPRLPRHAVKLKYVWCMGGLSFFSFLVLTVTGILLMFYYRPTAAHAYNDIVDLSEQVPFGILRELHRWAAHLMVILVWLHMLRVFLTGSYKPPRQFNWVVGVALLALTMFMSFTGYLLPWDQLSLWAVTVGTNMAGSAPLVGAEGPGSGLLSLGHVDFIGPGSDLRYLLLGGRTLSEAALVRFYVLHCVAIPVLMVVFLGVHFWRIRKDGGISSPL